MYTDTQDYTLASAAMKNDAKNSYSNSYSYY